MLLPSVVLSWRPTAPQHHHCNLSWNFVSCGVSAGVCVWCVVWPSSTVDWATLFYILHLLIFGQDRPIVENLVESRRESSRCRRRYPSLSSMGLVLWKTTPPTPREESADRTSDSGRWLLSTLTVGHNIFGSQIPSLVCQSFDISWRKIVTSHNIRFFIQER